jgi:exodeoxyribonuclease III
MYDALSLDTRKTISNAIVKHGLEPSYNDDYNWFLKATHNWNQVCNAGMVFGAFAIYEDQPELAQKTIERAIKTIPLAMEDYKPDGAYPEGYGYWGYGTTFNVLFLDAVESIYGTDFGLSKIQGFMETAGFYKNMIGVTGLSYNWGDAGGGYGSLTPAMFWFAQKSQSPSLLWVEKHHLDAADLSRLTRNRVLPATMIWGRNTSLTGIPAPKRKVWVGQGPNPVALMRTSWTDPDAIYLGFKAGSASVNHGHMDIGSFIMESDGVRWAMDFGSQNYESLESKGIQLFGRTQDAQRWTVFRLNNFVHNTLTIDGAHQRVKGYAKIDRFGDSDSFPFAISNITEAYEGQAKSIVRGVGIVDGHYVLVRDEIKAKSSPSTVRWNMLTPAEVTLEDDRAVLTRDGLEEVTTGLPGAPEYEGVAEPRAVGAVCGGLKVWSVYVPNGREVGHPHYRYKLEWLRALRETVAADAAGSRPFAVLGDFHIAPSDEDVWALAAVDGATHVTPDERDALAALREAGLQDVVPRPLKYDRPFTYWDYRMLGFPKNKGMRIDLVYGNPAFAEAVQDSYVDREERKGKGASDHAPVVVDLTL